MSAYGKPSEEHPRTVARDLGLDVESGPLSWADLVDAACEAYWANRPVPTCGTYPGYLMHLRRNTQPCAACKQTRAKVSAIQRRRRAA